MMSETRDELIEITPMPSSCFSVKLPEITLTAINDMLEKMYLHLRVDPGYLFCSKQDYEKIDAEVDRCTNYRIPSSMAADWVREPATVWCNQTTGKLMHIVILPKLEDGTLMFGFITY
jgi:hypothetical protein